MKGLSPSMTNYIKAVYELSSGGEGAHISDIATIVGVTKASASVAMRRLQEKKLVVRDIRRLVYLTKSGEHQAVLALDKIAIIRKFLIDVLEIDHRIADADACAMEHIISKDTLCALCRLNNRTRAANLNAQRCFRIPCVQDTYIPSAAYVQEIGSAEASTN